MYIANKCHITYYLLVFAAMAIYNMLQTLTKHEGEVHLL